MPRQPLDLTLDDLKTLAALVEKRPRSMLAAEKLLDVDRARLNRIVVRANRLVGEDLEWRVEGHIVPPPEVRRLVAAYNELREAIDASICSPIVSAGSSAAALLGSVAGGLKRPLTRAAFVRSRDVPRALLGDEVDLALLHAQSIESWSEDPELVRSLVWKVLVHWRAVRLRRKQTRLSQATISLVWERDSLGHTLSEAHQPPPVVGAPEWHCESFLVAVDMVRRGLVSEVILPDIYLPPPDDSLATEALPMATKGSLVGVCRRVDENRWGWLLDPDDWASIANKTQRA